MNGEWLLLVLIFICGGMVGTMITGGIYTQKVDSCKNETYMLGQELVELERYAIDNEIDWQNFLKNVYICERDYTICAVRFNNYDELVLIGRNSTNETLLSEKLIWIDGLEI